jgi:hypothetical protein
MDGKSFEVVATRGRQVVEQLRSEGSSDEADDLESCIDFFTEYESRPSSSRANRP